MSITGRLTVAIALVASAAVAVHLAGTEPRERTAEPTVERFGHSGSFRADSTRRAGPHSLDAVAPGVEVDEATSSAPDVPVAGAVRVVANDSLPVEGVEWSTDGETWSRARDHEVPPEAIFVRAVGRPAAPVPDGATEVELGTDAVLRLHAPGLGDAVDDIGVDVRSARSLSPARSSALCAAAGPGTVALAVDVDRLAEVAGPARVVATIRLRSGATLTAEWSPRSTEVRSVHPDVDPGWIDRKTAPLVLHETASWAPVGAERGATLRTLAELRPRVAFEDERLRVELQRVLEEFPDQTSRATTITYDDVPLGEDLLVTWQRSDGWYGRARILHDGRPAAVELTAPVRIRLRLLDPFGDVIEDGLRLGLVFPSRSAESLEVAWSGASWHRTDEPGVVELEAPQIVPQTAPSAEFSDVLPREGKLGVGARGFVGVEIDLTLEPGRTVDVGDVTLEFDGVLAHVEHAAPLPDHISHAEWKGAVTEVGAVRSRGTGESVLVLGVHDLDARAAWKRGDRPAAILVAGHGDEWIGLEAEGDRYVAVEPISVDVRLVPRGMDPIPAHCSVMFRWRGLEGWLAGGFYANGPPDVELDATVPRHGTEVFWREFGRPQESVDRTIGPPGSLREVHVVTR